MLGLDTLDVAIGLVFVYLMVSFVCSAAVELVEVFLKNRPKKLREGIKELLQSDDFVKKVYEDPFVNALYKGKYGSVKAAQLPSYIPGRNFALAVLNQLPVGAGNTNWERIESAVEGFFTPAERATLQAQRTANPPAPDPLLEKKEHVYKALKSALLTANGSVDNAMKGIEDWYNSSMDRVSGWFKRRTQYILLGFGLVCAVIYNVDTIAIVRRLATDKAVRAALVASAGAAVNEKQAATTGASTTDTTKNGGAAAKKPAGTATATSTTGTTTATDTTSTTASTTTSKEITESNKKEIAEAKDRWTKSIAKLEETHLPIGWGEHPVFDSKLIGPSVREHGLGWLLSAIAVSFGAPFWFDILNKFMVVRSTVKPKEKSGTEKSKDK
jgi:hypothetical protein